MGLGELLWDILGKSIQGNGNSKNNGSEEGNCLDWGDRDGGRGLGHHWRVSDVV